MTGNQANIEYFFRLLYNLMHGGVVIDYSALQAFLAHLWLWIIVVGYALSIVGLVLIVYITVRLFELRKREEEYYSTVIAPTEASAGVNPRWQHIETLMSDAKASRWREAIIEADIMLDDALGRKGYIGDGVGEKLKAVDSSDLHSLQDAWDVHKVRNQIAHEGSKFDLSETLAQRTVRRYETVLRELKAI